MNIFLKISVFLSCFMLLIIFPDGTEASLKEDCQQMGLFIYKLHKKLSDKGKTKKGIQKLMDKIFDHLIKGSPLSLTNDEKSVISGIEEIKSWGFSRVSETLEYIEKYKSC